METTIVVALIIAIPTTITGIAALIVALGVSRQIHEVHLSLNSRFDEWLKMAQVASFAQGHKAALEEGLNPPILDKSPDANIVHKEDNS